MGDRRHVPGTDDHRLRYTVVHDIAARISTGGDIHLMTGQRAPGSDVPEVLLGLLAGGGGIDVAGEHQRGVGRAVVPPEPILRLLERRALEQLVGGHIRGVVRMPLREARLEQPVPDLAVRLVLALAFLVAHHTALLVEHLLVERAEQMAHAVGLHPQRTIERGGRHVLEIVGPIGAGGAVLVGGAHLLEGLEELVAVVLGPLEHQVLEPVRELLPVGGFVLAADVVPDVDGDDRRLAVGVHDHRQPVVEAEALEGDVRGGSRCGGPRGRRSDGGREGEDEGGEGGQQAHRNGLRWSVGRASVIPLSGSTIQSAARSCSLASRSFWMTSS